MVIIARVKVSGGGGKKGQNCVVTYRGRRGGGEGESKKILRNYEDRKK